MKVFAVAPRLRRDSGRRQLSLDAWSVLFSGRSLRLRCSAGRPFGSCLTEAHCSRRVTVVLPLAGALDGRAAPCVTGTRCIGSCSSRPSRRSVVPGSGTGRIVARGLVGARRDAGWQARLLDAGLLDAVRIPVLVLALWSFGSTAVSRGVPLAALAPGGPLLASEEWFEGEIAPLNRRTGAAERPITGAAALRITGAAETARSGTCQCHVST